MLGDCRRPAYITGHAEFSAAQIEALTGRIATVPVLNAILALTEVLEARIDRIKQELQS
jgi:hypothetical protein